MTTRDVALKDVPVGAQPAQSLYSDEGALLHTAGFQLTASTLARLTSQGITSIELFEDSPPVDIEGTIRGVVRSAITLDVAIDPPEDQVALPPSLEEEAITKRIEEFSIWRGMDQSSEAVNAIREPLLKALETVHMLLVSLPSGSYGDAEAEHQLDTAILALALGTLLEYPERDLRVLACASLLHETGRYAFSNSMSGDDKLNSFLQREHPAFSATLLRGWVPDQHDLETAILQHHERYDGSGFPNGLRGLETPPGVLRKSQAGFMDRFAEILLIANAFSAHRLGLGDFDAASELDVITHLLESSEVLYNPSVVLELSKLIQRFPVGAPVRILSTSSGRFVGFTGVVRETDSESETLPIKNLLVTRNAKGQQVKPMEIEFKSERRARFALADSL